MTVSTCADRAAAPHHCRNRSGVTLEAPLGLMLRITPSASASVRLRSFPAAHCSTASASIAPLSDASRARKACRLSSELGSSSGEGPPCSLKRMSRTCSVFFMLCSSICAPRAAPRTSAPTGFSPTTTSISGICSRCSRRLRMSSPGYSAASPVGITTSRSGRSSREILARNLPTRSHHSSQQASISAEADDAGAGDDDDDGGAGAGAGAESESESESRGSPPPAVPPRRPGTGGQMPSQPRLCCSLRTSSSHFQVMWVTLTSLRRSPSTYSTAPRPLPTVHTATRPGRPMAAPYPISA
mmetsp:Transcript_29901/g.83571  ORF Transcript_29901/g.83571 Transcript_29901/m.83571 type:complete len:299 (+) Transcript_29901:361-1257(+)